MNVPFLVAWVGLFFLCTTAAGIGRATSDSAGYPDCEHAPINATGRDCPTWVATSITLGVGLFWGSLFAIPAGLAMPSAKGVKP